MASVHCLWLSRLVLLCWDSVTSLISEVVVGLGVGVWNLDCSSRLDCWSLILGALCPSIALGPFGSDGAADICIGASLPRWVLGNGAVYWDQWGSWHLETGFWEGAVCRVHSVRVCPFFPIPCPSLLGYGMWSARGVPGHGRCGFTLPRGAVLSA